MKQYKIYLLHAVLLGFTEMSFYIFGSLLFYLKTGSVINTLFFGLTLKAVALVIKSVLVKPFLKMVKSLGVIQVMVVSIFIWGAAAISLFLIKVTGLDSLFLFFMAGAVYAAAHSCYWMLSNAFGFKFIGQSKIPGQYSSYWQIATILAGASASLAGLFLHLDHNFLLLLFLMGCMLVASAIPLKYVMAPEVKVVSFNDCARVISVHGFWANINPEHDMTTVAVPLIILFTFGSLSKSIWISVTVALITMLFAYLVGHAKDRRSNKLPALGGITLALGMVAYGFIKSPLAFVVVGVLVGVGTSMVDTAREACAGRELTNNQDAIAGTIAIEFARSFGGFVGELTLIVSYIIVGSLWQPILILGAFSVLPKVFYAIKNIQAAKEPCLEPTI